MTSKHALRSQRTKTRRMALLAVAAAAAPTLAAVAVAQNAPVRTADDDRGPIKGVFDDHDKPGVDQPRSAAEGRAGDRAGARLDLADRGHA